MKKTLCFSFAAVLTFSLAGHVAAAPSVTAKENLARLVSTNQCPGCDLSGLNFNRMDLSKANLEGADLSMSTFFLTNLSYANLKNTTLSGAVFGGADLGDADLTGADLRGVSLDSAYLGGTKMTGEVVSTKPYEELGIDDIEKDVYIESQAIPKKAPEQKEVNLSERRDFNETPPVIVQKQQEPVKEKIVKPVETSSPPENSVPAAPSAKKSSKMQPVSVPAEEPDKGKPLQVAKADIAKEQQIVQEKSATESSLVQTKAVPAISAPVLETIEVTVDDKDKLLNLERLLDTKSCYGCDLSGLDLSGKNLKKVDLEKADLSGCNLEKSDLRKANLKGTLLVDANLKKARLDKADFYKADLRGADLTGASQKDADFDGAELEGVTGLGLPIMLQN